ncbi:hypothetical protein GCM10010441_34720 [Kitasatospora paracochleata]
MSQGCAPPRPHPVLPAAGDIGPKGDELAGKGRHGGVITLILEGQYLQGRAAIGYQGQDSAEGVPLAS